MEELLERARAYLSDLEADRNAALALSEQKAEEAKLIKARQEGFQAALELLSGETSAGNPASGEDRELSADRRGRDERASELQETRQRRGRRPIRELILRELSFSGQAMTAAQIAKAINYIPERTETALARWRKTARWFGMKRVAGQSALRGRLKSTDTPRALATENCQRRRHRAVSERVDSAR